MSKIVQSPGEFLSNMLEKHKLSSLKLSKDIYLSPSAATSIANGKTRISVPVALRLARYFNTNPEYWLKMQMDWDLAEAAQDKKLMDVVKKISKFQKDPSAGKKPAAKKPVAAKAAAKKTADGKAAGKKVAAKKPAAGKAVAKKPAAGKASPGKAAPAKKGAAKAAPAKRAVAKAKGKPASAKEKPAARRPKSAPEQG
ncbi:MAG: HigA family addiction module antitoxin [Treponema sp.]|nr:HigA family addiction module antitoxin [Treponema sp.]